MHSHTAKVLTWELNERFQHVPGTWGCTDCDETFDEAPSNGSITQEHTHTFYVHGCFACKVTTLQLNTGDANGTRDMSQKKWDKELDLYRDARKQGIQPEGTTTAKIRKALDVSDKTGHAFGSDL